MTNTDVPTGRKLNMEEKRKLEKLLLADIEVAAQRHHAARAKAREDVSAESTRKPPVLAKVALATYAKAQKQTLEASKVLREHGYDVSTQGSTYSLVVPRYGQVTPKPLVDFDKATAHAQAKFEELRRAYMLKLFAGGEEAQTLFSALAEELRAITK